MNRAILLIAALCGSATAQTWSLSGTVRDAEEGDQIKNVNVSLAIAKFSVLTDKNGKWSLGGINGVVRNGSSQKFSNGHSLQVVNGRLHLIVDGHDLMGRGLPSASNPALQAWAGREAGSSADTLIYAKDGYVTKKVAIFANQSGIQDSIYHVRGPEWVTASHANVKSDTTKAFVDTLRKITFKFQKSKWDSLMKAMADSCGAFGLGAGSTNPWGGPSTTCNVGTYELIENTALIWVPMDLYADGQVWKDVGIRLKGNGSLQTSWVKGSYSLPFRISTDKFEDANPLIKNQRFYGFQKISFFNAEQDSSGIRGPLAGEMFRQAGIAAPMSKPVQLYLDRGDGTPLDIGIYEMLEIPDNPFLKRNFGNDSGTLYKPLSKLDTFKDTEWVTGDTSLHYDDAKALIATINAGNRKTDTATWHHDLEAIIDVDGFLNWLSVNTAIVNWDAYGVMAHNYYLFDDRGRFRWITYDFGGQDFDYTFYQMLGQSPTTVFYDGGTSMMGNFPLVKNLLADKKYCEKYKSSMVRALADGGPLTVASYQAKVDKYGAMVASRASTAASVAKMRTFMTTRRTDIQASLNAKTCPIPQ